MHSPDAEVVQAAMQAAVAKEARHEKLTETERDLLLIVATKGFVGNGGLPYLFEQDLDFAACIRAFHRAGLAGAGELLETARSLFPAGALRDEARRGACLEAKAELFDNLGMEFCETLGLTFRSEKAGVLEAALARMLQAGPG